MRSLLSLAICSSRRIVIQSQLTKNPYQSYGITTSLLRRPFHHSSFLSSQLHPNKSTISTCPLFGTSPFQEGFLHRKTTSSRILVLRPSSSDFCAPKTAERLRLRDGIPKSYTLIYRSNFVNYLLMAQTVVFLTMGATLAGSILWLTSGEKTEEEKEEIKRQQRENFEQWKKENEESHAVVKLKEFQIKYGWSQDIFPSKPELGDLTEEGGATEFGILTFCMFMFAAAIFRIMRIMPVRIYRNEKTNHCVRIHYGHLLPGRLTFNEFLSGTVRKVKSRFNVYSDSLYKDGSGNRMILLEYFFRHPSDYNHLLGIQEDFMKEAVKQRVRDNPSREA